MSQKIQFRRGTTAQRTAVTLDSGEPGWDTDTERLYIGDGSTAGGVAVGGGSSTLVTEATSARTIDPATDAGKYIRFTGTGAKTCTFDDGDGFAASEEYHIANRGASGDVTLTPAGTMTLNPPAGGSLVVEPGMTVTVKMVATDEADVMGQTA